jgi:hypothetical protein
LYHSVDARDFTCEELKKIVAQEKIAYLHSGWWGGLFVKSKSYCDPDWKTVSNAYLIAKDTIWCNPGIYCRMKVRD